MSDEMMTLTPDSSAGASDGYGVGNAILDTIRDSADPEIFGTAGVNDGADVPVEQSTIDESFGYLSEPTNGDASNPGPIPYDRFREVNDRARNYSDRLDKWADVITQFEQQGYQSAADVQLALQRQQQEMAEQQIVSRYRELEQQELVDPATAQLQLDAELERYRYQQAMAEVSHYMVQQERQTALEQYPLAKEATALVDSLINAGNEPTKAAQMVHDHVSRLTQSLRSEVARQVAHGQRTPTPQSQASSAQAVVNGNQQGMGVGRQSLSQLMGINKNR